MGRGATRQRGLCRTRVGGWRRAQPGGDRQRREAQTPWRGPAATIRSGLLLLGTPPPRSPCPGAGAGLKRPRTSQLGHAVVGASVAMAPASVAALACVVERAPWRRRADDVFRPAIRHSSRASCAQRFDDVLRRSGRSPRRVSDRREDVSTIIWLYRRASPHRLGARLGFDSLESLPQFLGIAPVCPNSRNDD